MSDVRSVAEGYGEDLAWVHAVGFARLAVGAAKYLADLLDERSLAGGAVVDLGCGSGDLARILSDAGHRVLGVDLSAPLLEIARRRAPKAEFRRASFVGFEFPPCVAVTAIGEVLNYRFDPENQRSTRRDLFERAFRALVPGGVLLFDLAGPARIARSPQHVFLEREDWSVFVEATKEGETLTRRITTFRRVGGSFRRSREVHHLELCDPSETERTLEEIGFRVQRLREYGAVPLPTGVHGFLARRAREA